MKDATWFDCKGSNGNWFNGEYLIERAPSVGVVIWLNGYACVTHIKSFKKAYNILQQEFTIINKIER